MWKYSFSFLECREWIAPATALYFLQNILENYQNFSEILRDVEVNIVPVANPDGYKHTFTTVLLIKLTVEVLIFIKIIYDCRIACGEKIVSRMQDPLALAWIWIEILDFIGVKQERVTM